jgi:hypothetical protein
VLFFPWLLAEAYSWAAAVLFNEFDPSLFKHLFDDFERLGITSITANLQISDRVPVKTCCLG